MRSGTGQNDASKLPDKGQAESAKVGRRRRSIAEAVMEAVESRRLFSGSTELINGILYVRGDTGADNINISKNTTQFIIVVNGTSLKDPNNNPYLVANVNQLDVNTDAAGSQATGAGAGNDTVVISSGVNTPAFIYTGEDVDSVSSGSGNDTLVGGEYTDTLKGNNGNDLIIGEGQGTGTNTLLVGNNDIWGGAGDDTVSAGYGNDTVSGDAGADSIVGWGGSDLIYGDGRTTVGSAQSSADLANSDNIWAGGEWAAGYDEINTVIGGLGNDSIKGGNKGGEVGPGGRVPIVANYLYGDFITSSYAGMPEGNDYLQVGGGTNYLFGDSDASNSNSGYGADLFDMAGGQVDNAYGGAGIDTFSNLQDGTQDYIWSGAGYDVLDGPKDSFDWYTE